MYKKFEVFFLIVFVLSSCKSTTGKDINSDKVSNNKVNVLQLNISCLSQEEQNLQINNNSFVLVQPSLCETFGDYINSGKIVSLHLTGKFNDSIFDVYDGSYGISEYDSIKKSINLVKSERLSFGSIDFIKDLKEYRKSISYRIATANFRLIYKDTTIKNTLNSKYKLVYILKK